MRENIVVNTIVFEDLINSGVKQWQLFESVKSLGVSKIEIRREWIADFQEEIKKMTLEAQKHNIELLYSVPASLFVEKHLNKDRLLQYLDEADRMHVKMIKFVVGDFEVTNVRDVIELKKILHNKNLIVTVENDQTVQSGKFKSLKLFLDCCKEHDVPIYCTYDVGNWHWVQEDPASNAFHLAESVKYIHLKDVAHENGQPRVRVLDAGEMDWRTVVKILPPNIPLGIEHPCGTEPLKVLKEVIKKLADGNTIKI
ncbi:sugar phosphate isomerase/epimerase family protein [Pelosinus sp. sgz500959]|uniref:sugar phosphate isomerase/epimerase family protein n=1 Tax=Pelosinus sp. sgz500959 TaxID=3242472 RepID=UPI00366EE8AD